MPFEDLILCSFANAKYSKYDSKYRKIRVAIAEATDMLIPFNRNTCKYKKLSRVATLG
ncbi:hypothetical protein GCM10011391_38130 [Pullulanibacillus camelliae]|uniref:Uncharacterized protein n=1 Tax=Pullulanibacillus camelliae TaxID=1707096 RepID=A0A8J3E1Z5_9BACL|nr:hypothetical protein GCM10011391_38130 [Pullulanibacillus camelliae]